MTNRKKFKEVFGVDIKDVGLMGVGCGNMQCFGIECEDCTFCTSKRGTIWDMEYKEPTTKREIKVGDTVMVIDFEEQYTTYNALFNRSNLSGEIISRFNSGVDLNADLKYTVLEILEHENYNKYIAVIQNEFDEVYLINVDGLEVI